MKRCVWLWVVGVPLCALALTAPRGPVRHGGGGALDWSHPNFQNLVQDAGAIRINITNGGYSGNDNRLGESMGNPCAPWEWAPQMEFPKGSDQQYLFEAGLWIGAEVSDTGLTHRRVSVATDGWALDIYELWPGEGDAHGIHERSNIAGAQSCGGGAVYDPAARANQEYVATFSDTLAEVGWVFNDPVDGSHRPLGIRVQQTSQSWSSPDFSDFVLFEDVLTNISGVPLQNVYLGFYVDGDVGLSTLWDQHLDDITGFLTVDTLAHDTVNIPWIADNDGWDPQNPSGAFETPHVMGLKVLGAPQANVKWSYNWWVASTDADRDYGPSWIGGDTATPMGDAAKYRLLSNGERDFDQSYTNSPSWLSAHPQAYRDPCTGATSTHPWLAPSTTVPGDIADGWDTRFLYSCGPLGTFDHMQGDSCIYVLNPGAACTLTVALLAGRDFQNPVNPQTPGQPIDPARFQFAGLLRAARAAERLFRWHGQYQPPVPPQAFHPVSSAADAVTLSWQHPTTGTWEGYRLYKIDPAAPEIALPLNATPVAGTTYTATGLTLGSEWRLAVETLDDSGFVSARADTLVRVGAALPVSGLAVTADSLRVLVTWQPSVDPSVTGYRVLRRSPMPSDSLVFTTTDAHYQDEQTVSGRRYEYWVIADNNRGVPSYPAGPVAIMPWAPQHRILLVDETDNTVYPNPFGGFPRDSVDALYARLLAGCGEGYDYLEQPSNVVPVFTLEQLAQFDLVIYHSEEPIMGGPSPDIAQRREQILTDYVLASGRLLRAARNFGRNLGLGPGWTSGYTMEQQITTPLHFDSLWVMPSYNPSASLPTPQFIGATPAQSGFPELHIDSAKVAELRYRTQHVTFFPEVDLFWPRGYTQPLYRAVLQPGDTNGFANQPVGVIGLTEIILGFPLYILREADAQALMAACIDTLRSLAVPEPPPGPHIPESVRLWQNYPNPFNPATEIVFALPRAARVTLAIYNVLGQRVATLVDEVRTAGTHRVRWDGSAMASGIYFCRLEAAGAVQTRKLMLLR